MWFSNFPAARLIHASIFSKRLQIFKPEISDCEVFGGLWKKITFGFMDNYWGVTKKVVWKIVRFAKWQLFIDTIIWKFVGNKAKGRTSKRVLPEKKARQIFRRTNIFYPRTYAYQRVKNVRFFGKFGVLCFLETPILRFALLPYYRRVSIGMKWVTRIH